MSKRVHINEEIYHQYHSVKVKGVSLSALLSELLANWVVNQQVTEQLKQEFNKLRQ